MNKEQKNATPEWVAAITDKLETGIQELFDSEKYQAYLTAMAQFHRYSSGNIMLILQQMPTATRVASFKMWKEQFNRMVKKGEKSIRIFAPIEVKVKVETQKTDPTTKAYIRDKDGNIITEEQEIKQQRFKLVPVFDVSQTDGDPLPQLTEYLTGNIEDYNTFFKVLKTISPLPVGFEEMPESKRGYCIPGEKIAIREGMSEMQTISTFVHELAHAAMHDNNADLDAVRSRAAEEIEAESVAYVVCQKFGIDTAPKSFGYLVSWARGDLEKFKQSLGRIQKTASGMIDKIETEFAKLHEKETETRSTLVSTTKSQVIADMLAQNAAKSREKFSSVKQSDISQEKSR